MYITVCILYKYVYNIYIIYIIYIKYYILYNIIYIANLGGSSFEGVGIGTD